MASATNVRVEGLRELERDLRNIDFGLKSDRGAFRKELRNYGTREARKLKAGTPRRTGIARRNVRVSAKVRVHDFQLKVHYKGRTAGLMGMRERGTIRQRARPFFGSTTSGWEQRAVSELGGAVRRIVEGKSRQV